MNKNPLLNPTQQLCTCKKKVILYKQEGFLGATSKEEMCAVERYNALLEKQTAKEEVYFRKKNLFDNMKIV